MGPKVFRCFQGIINANIGHKWGERFSCVFRGYEMGTLARNNLRNYGKCENNDSRRKPNDIAVVNINSEKSR